MNPLLFKAHPLQWLTVELLANPASHSLGEFIRLFLVYLALNVPWAAGVRWASRKAAGSRLSYGSAYLLGMPSLVLYVPMVLTLLSDVLAHAFRWSDRFILVFALVVATQMLGVLFGAALKRPCPERAVGLHAGIAVAMLLFLLSLPYGLGLLGLSAGLSRFWPGSPAPWPAANPPALLSMCMNRGIN